MSPSVAGAARCVLTCGLNAQRYMLLKMALMLSQARLVFLAGKTSSKLMIVVCARQVVTQSFSIGPLIGAKVGVLHACCKSQNRNAFISRNIVAVFIHFEILTVGVWLTAVNALKLALSIIV